MNGICVAHSAYSVEQNKKLRNLRQTVRGSMRRVHVKMGIIHVKKTGTLLANASILYSILGAQYDYGSVYCSSGKCTYKADVLDTKGATAYATYNDTLMETGWGVLDVMAGFGAGATDDDLMFAAGYLEGVLTAK
jgi:hypothetical protein